MTRRLHTTEQTAEFLQCRDTWLKEMARLRKIPHTLIGGAYRFSDEHIEEIVRIFERLPESETRMARSKRRATPSLTQQDSTAAVTPLRARPPRPRAS